MGRHIARVVAILFLVGASLFIVIHSLHQDFGHDEHQFIASAQMIAQHHLLPYRDFAFFHTPNILFVYALLFQFTSHLFLAARLFSATCAALSVLLIFITALRLWPDPWRWTSVLVAISAVLLLVNQPLFLLTSGLAWNHDFPELLLLLAVLAQCKWMRCGNHWLLLLSAALLGLAAGTRLTYVLPIVAFAGAILLTTRARERLRSAAVFGAGLMASLIPSAVLFALAPSAFIFGNLGYARLNTIYGRDIRHWWPVTVTDRVGYFFRTILLEGHGALLLLVLLFLIVLWMCLRGKTGARVEVLFIGAVIFCCLPGSFAAAPSRPQYFYQPVPLLVLGIVFGMVSLYAQAKVGERKLLGSVMGAVVIGAMRWKLVAACVGVVWMSCVHPQRLADTQWIVPEEVHRVGLQMQANEGGGGKVLTMVPIYALEGGMDIYAEFATGPFAWRTAPLMNAAERAKYKMVSATELDELLRGDPPRGILVGNEPIELEEPLIQYAKEHGYVERGLQNGLTVWVMRE